MSTVNYSTLDLIGREIESAKTKRNFFSKIIQDYKKKRPVLLRVHVPAKLFCRIKDLTESLEDKEFEFEINDVFAMIAKDILSAYNERIDGETLRRGLLSLEGKVVKRYGESEEFMKDFVKDAIPVTVSLEYAVARELEWIAHDMHEIAKDDDRVLSVEDMLRITFIDLSKKIQNGQIPDLRRRLVKFVKTGKTA
ncbi:hypothetical protein BC30090_p401 (plasmid) [Bacillus cereus]|uniref:hypothetical protein n=1 Tax=Bacillus TaxID=1386 RepID=UPI0013D7768B|nr:MULTISPECIES: hypothetical protein [Bacillus]NEL01374.1 hypothetical protein [Bacillus mobilis]BCD26928.1 hypothetical protein BC30090_p401 [Bacillus cereus]